MAPLFCCVECGCADRLLQDARVDPNFPDAVVSLLDCVNCESEVCDGAEVRAEAFEVAACSVCGQRFGLDWLDDGVCGHCAEAAAAPAASR